MSRRNCSNTSWEKAEERERKRHLYCSKMTSEDECKKEESVEKGCYWKSNVCLFNENFPTEEEDKKDEERSALAALAKIKENEDPDQDTDDDIDDDIFLDGGYLDKKRSKKRKTRKSRKYLWKKSRKKKKKRKSRKKKKKRKSRKRK